MGLVLGGDLQECGDLTWRVSDCEELVGEFQEMIVNFVNILIFCFPARLDESLDDGVSQRGVGDEDATVVVTGLEVGT